KFSCIISEKPKAKVVRKMFSEERQIQILNLLRENHRVEVRELSKLLKVSEVTIRNDLAKMERNGLLKRTHGGAILVDEKEAEISYLQQTGVRTEQKKKIAKVATQLIGDHEKIVIGTGSTILQMANYLGEKKNLTIITPSLPFAYQVSSLPNITIIVTGGYYRPSSGVLFGPFFRDNTEKLFVEKAFIGAKGVNEDFVTDADMIEAEVGAALLARAKTRVLLVDSTKVGYAAFATIANTADIDILITDEEANPKELEKIARKSVEIIIAR
ncbi:MAG: DeoR/GlpR family DNA-binding transcription regulator, partial [Candidatus Caldatribacteriaceae bacterium]